MHPWMGWTTTGFCRGRKPASDAANRCSGTDATRNHRSRWLALCYWREQYQKKLQLTLPAAPTRAAIALAIAAGGSTSRRDGHVTTLDALMIVQPAAGVGAGTSI